MRTVLGQALDFIDRCGSAIGSEAMGVAMLEALRPWGARSIWARSFDLTPDWIDPKINAAYRTRDYVYIRRADWRGSQAQIAADDLCPLAQGAARFQRPFLASEATAGQQRRYAPYHEAMAAFGVGDTLAVPHFGPSRSAEALTLWLERSDFDRRDLEAIKLSCMMLLERLRPSPQAERPSAGVSPLSPRERDCLAFVADGKSDWEISVILGISQATAHSHVENAKRKLEARTRAQAVAKLIAMELT
ncbi:MAG: hypothetical protein IT548_14155 [Alphaproteobacteria bacterium]|nr:hypothetical protein [Alphaproteobacteria bacterium]